MDAILQGLLDMAGVNAAVLFDGAGRLLAHSGRSVYDRSLCEQVGGPLARAIDSLQLQHEDWESASALVADATLNPAFATVAIRVSANKLKRALDGGASSSVVGNGLGSSVGSLPSFVPAPVPAGAPPVSQSSVAVSGPVLASSGLSWSRIGPSGVTAADPPSASYLGSCVHELARHVGPMAKIFVEEAVRKVCPEIPFSLAASRALADELATRIEDEVDRQAFLASLKKPGGT
jgi:hypothetical protein